MQICQCTLNVFPIKNLSNEIINTIKNLDALSVVRFFDFNVTKIIERIITQMNALCEEFDSVKFLSKQSI